MRGTSFAAAVACCALLASPDVRAADVTLGWDAATRWDSNVLNNSSNEQDDFSIRTGPSVEVEQLQGDVTGRLFGATFWEGFLDTDGADNFEFFADAEGAWRINARNELSFSNRLARTDALTSQLVVEDGLPSATGQDVAVGRDSTFRNNAILDFSHQWSPLVSIDASVVNSIFDFESDTQSDGMSTRGAVQALRALNERMSVGLGAAFTRQDFDASESSSESGADIIEVFGIWNYQISPTLSLTSSLGPALNRPDEIEQERDVQQFPTLFSTLLDAASCPQPVVSLECSPAIQRDPVTGQLLGQPAVVSAASIPVVRASFLGGGPESDDALTLFGRLSLVKTWERVSARLSVERRSSAASGNGVSTDLTSASASLSWQPDRRWHFTTLAAWTLQTSATDFPFTATVIQPSSESLFFDGDGRLVQDPSLAAFRVDGAAESAGIIETGSTDSAFETTSYQLQFRATRRITGRLTARGSLSLFRSDFGGDLQSDRTTDAIRVDFGLRWELAPIRL